jgi:hypothetical protein
MQEVIEKITRKSDREGGRTDGGMGDEGGVFSETMEK